MRGFQCPTRFRQRLAIAAGAVSVLALVAQAASAFNFFGIYWEMKKGGRYEAVALGIPGSDIQKAFDMHADEGKVPTRFEGYEADGKPFFNLVFRKKGGGAWAARHGMSGKGFQNFFDEQAGRGRCLRSLDVYRSGSSARYVAIFKTNNCSNQVVYHGVSRNEHQARFNDITQKGWVPVNVSVAIVDRKRVYAAFYVKKKGPFVARSLMTANDLGQENRKQFEAGLRPVYLNAYTNESGKVYFSAIWRDVRDAKVSVGGKDTAGLLAVADEATENGLVTRYVTGYGVSGKHRFHVALIKP